MDTALLTLRHIEVFRAIMQTGSVTEAAALLNTSQPTVSRELARMEYVCGMRLFERGKGRLQATQEAGTLFGEVQRAYHGMERVRQAVEEIRLHRGVQVSVICQPGLAQSLLPHVCKAFLDNGSDAGIRITPQDQPLLGEWLAAQQFDLGVMESGVAVAGVEHSVIFEGQQVCVLPPGHALARRKVIKPADLAGQPFIRLADGDPQRISIDAAFAAAGVSYRPILQTHSSAAACAMVAQGLGVTVVNPLMAWLAQGQGLVIRRFAPAIPYAVLLALPRHRLPSAAVSAFADAVRRSGKQLAKALAAALKPSFTMDRYEP